MTDLTYLSAPAGYIVLSRAEYDEILEQRFAARADRIDMEKSLQETIRKLEKVLTERSDENAALGRLANGLSVKLKEANETIMSLKVELHAVYDELSKTDKIREGSDDNI